MRWLEYLDNARITDDPAGDFISDARRDRRMPDAGYFEEVKEHVARTSRGPAWDVALVVSAARSAWRRYVKLRRKQRDNLL